MFSSEKFMVVLFAEMRGLNDGKIVLYEEDTVPRLKHVAKRKRDTIEAMAMGNAHRFSK